MKTVTFASVVGALCLCAGSASAARYVATFTGTVSSGYDVDRFGVGGDLSGLVFTAVYEVYTDAPGAELQDTQSGYQALLGFGSASPILSASITINEHTVVSGLYDSRIDENFNYSFESGLHYLYTGVVTDGIQAERIDLELGIYGPPGLLSDGDVFTAPLGTFTQADGTFYGSFNDITYVNGLGYTRARMTLEATTVTFTSAAPEPATWVLGILGFGLAGTALRLRRGVLTSASDAA